MPFFSNVAKLTCGCAPRALGGERALARTPGCGKAALPRVRWTSRAASTDRDTLLRVLLRSFGERYDRWARSAGDAEAAGLAADYLAACASIGRRVRAELPGERTLTGLATGVDPAGALLVATADQGEVPVGAVVVQLAGQFQDRAGRGRVVGDAQLVHCGPSSVVWGAPPRPGSRTGAPPVRTAPGPRRGPRAAPRPASAVRPLRA